MSVTGGGSDGLLSVSPAEERGVHEERMQLMQPDSVAPSVEQRPGLVVRGEDAVEMWRSGPDEHREVGLPVPAVGCGVDEPAATVASPEHVAAPQVAVNPRRRLVVIG